MSPFTPPAALALIGIVRRTLTGAAREIGSAPPRRGSPSSSRLLWALHPLQTETVVGIAQRTESLCGLFYLLTLYGFIRGTESRAAGLIRMVRVSSRRLPAGMGSEGSDGDGAPSSSCSTIARSSPADLPRRGANADLLRGASPARGCCWPGSFGGAAARAGASAGFGLGVSSWTYLLKQCEAIALYLKLVVLAASARARLRHRGGPLSVAEVWHGSRRRRAAGGDGLGAGRRPVARFCRRVVLSYSRAQFELVPLVTQTMAEHRMYLPLAALACLVVVVVYRWLGSLARWLLGAVGVGLAGYDHRSESRLS